MDTLRSLLKAYLDNTITTDDFADQFIEFWNEIRIEQNKAIDASGIREELDKLWKQYKDGDLDEVTYGMKWTETLTKVNNVRIAPQSIVYTLGNDIYNQVTLYQELEHLDTQEIPKETAIQANVKSLQDAIDN